MDSEGRPGRYRLRGQNDCEKRASRNSPSLAVALNCGMGSSSLNAEVNAFERLQIVRGRKSSYFGSKYRSCTVRRKVFWSFQLALHKRLVDDDLRSDSPLAQLSAMLPLACASARSYAAFGQHRLKGSPRARTTSSVSR